MARGGGAGGIAPPFAQNVAVKRNSSVVGTGSVDMKYGARLGLTRIGVQAAEATAYVRALVVDKSMGRIAGTSSIVKPGRPTRSRLIDVEMMPLQDPPYPPGVVGTNAVRSD
jgi:hypothetical protein